MLHSELVNPVRCGSLGAVPVIPPVAIWPSPSASPTMYAMMWRFF